MPVAMDVRPDPIGPPITTWHACVNGGAAVVDEFLQEFGFCLLDSQRGNISKAEKIRERCLLPDYFLP
jgi:hypothetical protein